MAVPSTITITINLTFKLNGTANSSKNYGYVSYTYYDRVNKENISGTVYSN